MLSAGGNVLRHVVMCSVHVVMCSVQVVICSVRVLMSGFKFECVICILECAV